MNMTRIKYVIGLTLSLQLNYAWTDIAPETIGIEKLEAANPHRLYLTDLALGHAIDGRIHILNGDNYRYLGLIGTGLFGITALSNTSDEMYVATTYYSKGTRGERTELLETYNTENLIRSSEIEIPPRHAHALPYVGTITSSMDDRFVYIQNATPASSITLVDRKAEKFVSEVTTPGCWIILPAASNLTRFSTMCGDGTFLTVTHDANGKPTSQNRSEKLFDPDNDPLFVQGSRIGDVFYFISYKGLVHEINVGGDTAISKNVWSVVTTEEDKQAGWRPGGYQLISVDKNNGRLYIAMHSEGKEGTHKYPAEEIWVLDLNTKKRVQRTSGGNSVAMTLTKESNPFLYLYDGVEAKIHKYATMPKLKPISQSEPVGEFAGLIQTH